MIVRDYQIPRFSDLRMPADKPDESAITEAELAEPMTLDQADIELRIVNEHIAQHRALLGNLKLETQQLRRKYEADLADLDRRAAALNENLTNLQATRRQLHGIRRRAGAYYKE